MPILEFCASRHDSRCWRAYRETCAAKISGATTLIGTAKHGYALLGAVVATLPKEAQEVSPLPYRTDYRQGYR
jgi:hypothetical protein